MCSSGTGNNGLRMPTAACCCKSFITAHSASYLLTYALWAVSERRGIRQLLPSHMLSNQSINAGLLPVLCLAKTMAHPTNRTNKRTNSREQRTSLSRGPACCCSLCAFWLRGRLLLAFCCEVGIQVVVQGLCTVVLVL